MHSNERKRHLIRRLRIGLLPKEHGETESLGESIPSNLHFH